MVQSSTMATAASIPSSPLPRPGLLNPVPRPRWATAPAEATTALHDFRCFTFETRRSGEEPTCPARTVGMIAIAAGNNSGVLRHVGPREAVSVCVQGPSDLPPEAARDKVVFCDQRGTTLVFQANRQQQTATLCACGNASGAAAALLGQLLNRRRPRQLLHLPEGDLTALTRLEPVLAGWRVEQTWSGCRFQVESARLCRREAAVCRGTFNDYVILRLPSRQAVDELSLEEVQALWQEARPWGFEDPLRSRLVAVAPGTPHTWARFFTCGRLHPGAPLTGLAALALAAPHVAWLAEMLASQTVEHARGRDTMPVAAAAAGSTSILFPPIEVLLRPHPIAWRQ